MFFKDKQEYENYLRKNKVSINEEAQKYFEWSEDGRVLLQKSMFRESALDVSSYTNCIRWAMLKNSGTMVLLKSQFGDIYRDLPEGGYYIAMYNNVLLPQIANQFENQSAQYYIAKEKNCKDKRYERNFILTLDFKTKDEEIMHGEDILEDIGKDLRELNIENLLNALDEYLSKYRYSDQDKERIKIDFIKQSFFNRFIKQHDENNHNWGILINERTHSARIAPLYDMECSCDIGKKSKHMRTTNDGSFNGLEQFMQQYSNQEWFKWYMEEIIDNFDLEKAFEQSQRETNIQIPEQYKQKYRDFFAVRFYELKQAYEKVFIIKEENAANKDEIMK